MTDLNDDEDLRYALDRVAPPPPDLDAALCRLGPRITRYRRHRRLAAAAVVAGLLVASGAAGLAVRSTEGARVNIVDRPPVPTSTLAPPTTAPVVAPTRPATTLPLPAEDPGTTLGPAAAEPSPTSTAPLVDAAPVAPRHTGARPSPADEAPTAETEPTTLAPSTTVGRPSASEADGPTSTTPVVTQRFSSNGGSVTVRSDGSSLSLVAVDPAPGWQVDEEHAEADQVEVKFRRSGQEASVRVTLVNGQLHQVADD